MTTIYGSDIPVNEIFAISDPATNFIKVRSWLRDDQLSTPNQMDIVTFPLNFDGKKTRKQIVAVNIHATSGAWGGQILINENAVPLQFGFTAYPDPLYSIYSPAPSPGDPGAVDIVCLAAQFNTDGTPVIGYRFVFDVQKNADNNPAKVWAIDIGYMDMEEPGDGDP